MYKIIRLYNTYGSCEDSSLPSFLTVYDWETTFSYCLLIILPVGAGGSSVEQAGVIATGGLIRPAASPQLTDPLAVTHRRAIGFEGVWCGSVCVCE